MRKLSPSRRSISSWRSCSTRSAGSQAGGGSSGLNGGAAAVGTPLDQTTTAREMTRTNSCGAVPSTSNERSNSFGFNYNSFADPPAGVQTPREPRTPPYSVSSAGYANSYPAYQLSSANQRYRLPSKLSIKQSYYHAAVLLCAFALAIEAASVSLSVPSNQRRIIPMSTLITKAVACCSQMVLMATCAYVSVLNRRSCTTKGFAGLVLLAGFVRAAVETDELLETWDVPILPKLSSTYCNMRLQSKTFVAKCVWHDGWAYFRLKELCVIGVTLALPFAFAKIASERRPTQLRKLANVMLGTVGVDAVFEGTALPLATLIGMDNAPDYPGHPITRANLTVAIMGSVLIVASVAFLLCFYKPAQGAPAKAVAVSGVVLGALVRALGEVLQVTPIRHGPIVHISSTYQILVVEVVTRIVSLFLIALAAALFSWSVLEKPAVFQRSSSHSSCSSNRDDEQGVV
ncbi:hypothetical protein DIPPA_06887 [Diplonema papillatum]|nr:hypothetical protein DIPPA_06887 [Diplonema papillatum]